jgi:3-deoxy-manno-octulosonate cytidylyltransferase (CMP-KDO synthetase)
MIRIVIPARYKSTRLPAKPLAMIGDKTMLEHVYLRALEAGADSVVIATDDARIQQHAQSLGAEVCMTAEDHPTGTDRIAEVVELMGYGADDIIVNLQGDCPFLPGQLLKQVAQALYNATEASVSTLYTSINSEEEIFNPNIAKIVLDKNNYALYFSRAPIPWLREQFGKENRGEIDLSIFHAHIGVYAYRASFVQQYRNLPMSPLETHEGLEQIRVLWNGYKIIAAKAAVLPGQEVNTPEDLAAANKLVRAII